MSHKKHKSDLIDKDLLRALHGTACDASGNELYLNGEIVRHVLQYAQKCVTAAGEYTCMFVVDKQSLRWCACARFCAACHRICARDNMKTCSGCKILYYCSTYCQKQHWKGGHREELCKHTDEELADVRPMLKALDTIERIVVEKSATFCDNGMQTNAAKSPLRSFMRKHGIEADTFMAIPIITPTSTLYVEEGEEKPDTIGIVFFQSENLSVYLEQQFNDMMSVAKDKSKDQALRERGRFWAKDILQQTKTISGKMPRQMLVMGSFDGYPIGISRVKMTAHGTFFPSVVPAEEAEEAGARGK